MTSYALSVPEIPPLELSLGPYLDNNSPPSDDLVVLAKAKLAEADAIVEVLKAQIASLRRRAAQINQIQDRYRSVTSVIRRIPAELIVEIVKACFPPDLVLGPQDRVNFKRFRCVCSRWRAALLSSPELWQGLAFPIAGPESELLAQPPVLVDTVLRWYDRAGNIPLTLCVLESEGRMGSMGSRSISRYIYQHLCRVVEATAEMPQRHWKRIELPMYDPYFVMPTLKTLTSLAKTDLAPWANIQTLRMSVMLTYVNHWPFSQQRRSFSSALPSLEALEIRIFDGDHSVMAQPLQPTNNIPIHHPNLHTLSIDSAPDVILHVASQLPALKNLKLLKVSQPRGPLLASELRSLERLELCDTRAALQFVGHLVTPTLRTLVLGEKPDYYLAQPWYGPLPEEFTDFVGRCSSLATLVLNSGSLSERHFAECIDTAQNVVHIIVPCDFAFLKEFLVPKCNISLPRSVRCIRASRLSPTDFEVIKVFHKHRAGEIRDAQAQGSASDGEAGVGVDEISFRYDEATAKMPDGWLNKKIQELHELGITLSQHGAPQSRSIS
ncbi:hypothetical protein FA15DRAFT_698232 [Coprinopsis marcescibilis]|uniref:F-box domain-containing protein n=1 Tax=Coprinopsis marcescibilis TaxID=230819 RepID=A0A5C3KE23_COPMA|nr:hypothetical protein FA15DRAFT_698232 [Coprinopsis marcescibilis]